MEQNYTYESIPKEKFQFAKNRNDGHDLKLDTKPVGYFRDAFNRFCKNKASIVAAIIIILIVLYALIVPLFSRAEFTDSYYAKKSPRSTVFTFLDGGRTQDYNERYYAKIIAMGVGAEDGDAHGATYEEGINSYYQPFLSLKSYSVKNGVKTYTTKVDTYLAVGFLYWQVSQSEYQKIKEYEKETGLQVIYPLVANNEYCLDSTDANFWYKTDSKGNPLDENDKQIDVGEGMQFVDNYLRDADGNVRDWQYAGGGNGETAEYKVRILYYNYYCYKHGFEPSYIFGTDSQGYDLASRLANGIRLSLLVSVAVSVINLFLGTVYGAVEGYYGGATDLIMERISDILSGVPFIVVATLFQIHLASKVGAIPSLLFAFVMTGWIGTASRTRTQFYRFKNQEYVLAARTLGAKDRRIIWKHIFPNSLGTIITSSVLVIPGVIFSESMLSYLGIVNLGGASATSLGTLLSEASSIWTQFPHLMLFPATVIALLMICFNLFGNGLRDAFNPSLRGAED